jgi:hypothetical protein
VVVKEMTVDKMTNFLFGWNKRSYKRERNRRANIVDNNFLVKHKKEFYQQARTYIFGRLNGKVLTDKLQHFLCIDALYKIS